MYCDDGELGDRLEGLFDHIPDNFVASAADIVKHTFFMKRRKIVEPAFSGVIIVGPGVSDSVEIHVMREIGIFFSTVKSEV